MRIDTSIQDFLRKINSRILTVVTPFSLIVVTLFCLSFLLFILTLAYTVRGERHVFVYQENDVKVSSAQGSQVGKRAYFASKSGKVYYSAFCKGGKRVKESSRIYFESEAGAKGSGRTLSKLCE